MSVDQHAGTAPGRASDAALLHRPPALELLRRSPHPLTGRRVLDAGAGRGLGSAALAAAGARPVALGLSVAMLRRDHRARPAAVVGDLTRLPLADGCVDDAFAAFVLDDLPRPAAGLAELRRVTAPGGAVLAAVSANVPGKAPVVVDEAVERQGLRTTQSGTAATMRAAAEAAGLRVVEVVQAGDARVVLLVALVP